MQIMDVTLRESVYYGKGLTNDDALEYLSVLKSNISNKYVQYVEIGYLNNDKDSPLNYNEDYFNKAIDICKDTYKVSAMMHVPKANISKWNKDIIKRLDLVRVVVGSHVPDELVDYIEYMHSLGVKISVNITYVASLSDEKIISEIERAHEFGVDYIFCADSSGSFVPAFTKHICELMKEHKKDMIAGVHLHDHMQMSLANYLELKNAGMEITDVSVTGAGKGGGNLKMEQGLLLNNMDDIDESLLIGLKNMIEYFSDLIERDGKFYVQNMLDFFTGLYRLTLKVTDNLESECLGDSEKYIHEVVSKYKVGVPMC